MRLLYVLLALIFVIVCLVGCIPIDPNNSSLFPELVLAEPAPRPPAAGTFAENEPNDDFVTPDIVYMESLDIELTGTISADVSLYDRDIYELGPAFAGDRILADLSVSTNEDVVLGLFDDRYELLAYIDPRSLTSGPHSIDIAVRQDTHRLYAVVDTRSISSLERPYTAHITVENGTGVADPHPQVVVLAFQGGQGVQVGYRLPVNVPAFDADNISPRFAGQTNAIIQEILQLVREDYQGLNVDVYLDTDPYIPSGERSVLYFGTYDSRLLGLADNIDPYNTDTTQTAILYTDTFSIFDIFAPTVEEISQVLANVASHEVGHLLGLRHTADVSDLMDVTASARQMLLDQWFSIADLDQSVLSVGSQDAPSLLSWAVGGQLLAKTKNTDYLRQRAIEAAGGPDDFYIPRSKLGSCSCSNCPVGDHVGRDGE
jgi:predicted Zn-dependent protease with MMP-like domain